MHTVPAFEAEKRNFPHCAAMTDYLNVTGTPWLSSSFLCLCLKENSHQTTEASYPYSCKYLQLLTSFHGKFEDAGCD